MWILVLVMFLLHKSQCCFLILYCLLNFCLHFFFSAFCFISPLYSFSLYPLSHYVLFKKCFQQVCVMAVILLLFENLYSFLLSCIFYQGDKMKYDMDLFYIPQYILVWFIWNVVKFIGCFQYCFNTFILWLYDQLKLNTRS